jgi:hypothetical protein
MSATIAMGVKLLTGSYLRFGLQDGFTTCVDIEAMPMV